MHIIVDGDRSRFEYRCFIEHYFLINSSFAHLELKLLFINMWFDYLVFANSITLVQIIEMQIILMNEKNWFMIVYFHIFDKFILKLSMFQYLFIVPIFNFNYCVLIRNMQEKKSMSIDKIYMLYFWNCQFYLEAIFKFLFIFHLYLYY